MLVHCLLPFHQDVGGEAMSAYDDVAATSSYVDIAVMSSYADNMDAGRTYPARSLTRLGQAIKALRRARGMTQANLADAIGVSRQWIIGIEAGAKERAEVGLIMRTLDELDASLLIRDDSDDE